MKARMQMCLNIAQTRYSSLEEEAKVEGSVFYTPSPRLKNILNAFSSLASGFVLGFLILVAKKFCTSSF